MADSILPGGPVDRLRDRDAPVDLFALVPTLTLEFEPVLAQLDPLLDDDGLFQAVRADRARRRPRTSETGRPSTPVEVLLRRLVVRRLYGWSYAETEHVVGDSLVLRQCCRLGLARAPDDTTLLRWAALLRPATLDALLDHVVALARRQGAPAEREQRAAYARLCDVARRVVRPAGRVRRALAAGAAGERAGRRVAAELDRLLPLVGRAIDQAERRVLRGERVSAEAKVVSLVEPPTAIITRHTPGKQVEFGRKRWLAEADGGIITAVQVLDGAPPDAPHVVPSLARPARQFGRPPRLLTGDRGCSTALVRRAAATAGVHRVALPHTGPPSAASRARARERWFRRGYRWRAGIEGRIGVLQRVYRLDRCPDHGADGLERWVGLGVLTANLVTIARATAAR